MRTEQIILALNIAREKSISKAAETMFISQPNASSMLKVLESELGYKLFDRTGGVIILTDEGKEFIEYARSIEHSLQGISQISKPIKHYAFHILSIKYDASKRAFAELCKKYHSDKYSIQLSYQIITKSEDAIRMVKNGHSDIAIGMCSKSLYEAAVRNAKVRNLEADYIGQTHLEITCNKDHPIIRGNKINYKILGEYTGIASASISVIENYLPQFLANQGADVGNTIAMEAGDLRLQLLKDINGYMLSIPVPAERKTAFGLKSVPLKDADLAIFAMYRKDSQNEELIREYVKECKRQVDK
jgi:DNA-binding transcriptional LysR family regulator